MKIYGPNLQNPSISNATIGEINATGGEAVVTKEYADATYTGATGNLQKRITDPTYTIVNADNKYTLIFDRVGGCIVTLDFLSTANFECSFFNDNVGDVDFIDGTAAGSYIDGTKLEQNKVAALTKLLATHDYKFKGQLTV